MEAKHPQWSQTRREIVFSEFIRGNEEIEGKDSPKHRSQELYRAVSWQLFGGKNGVVRGYIGYSPGGEFDCYCTVKKRGRRITFSFASPDWDGMETEIGLDRHGHIYMVDIDRCAGSVEYKFIEYNQEACLEFLIEQLEEASNFYWLKRR